jgi:type VI protein secretion system component Hcp
MAAYDLFLLDFQKKIKGESLDETFKETFEVEGINFQGSNLRDPNDLASDKPGTGNPTFGDLAFSQNRFSQGTLEILQALCAGTVFDSIVVHCCQRAKDKDAKSEEGFKVTMTKAAISSMAVNLSDHDHYTFTIAYQKIEFEQVSPSVKAGFDLAKHVAVT